MSRKLINKAVKCVERGAFRDAEKLYRKVLRTDPDHLDANYLLGALCAEQRRAGEAEHYLAVARRLRPQSPYIWVNLGGVYDMTKRYGEAIKCYERALSLKPDLLELNVNLASTYAKVGREAEAEALYRRILDREPGNRHALAGLAAILERSGCRDEARALLASRVEQGERHPMIIAAYSTTILNGAPDQDALLHCEALLLEARTGADMARQPAMERNIHYMLARVYDALGRHDDAFEQLRAFHEDGVRPEYSAAHDRAALTAVHTPDALGAPEAPQGPDQLVFIIGTPRSGTTLLDRILSSHSAVTTNGECDVLAPLAEAWARDKGCSSPVSLAGQLDAKEKRALADAYLDGLQHKPGGGTWAVDKSMDNERHVGLIASLFPRALMLDLRRDPRDVCISCYFNDFVGGLDYTASLQAVAEKCRHHMDLMDAWAQRGVPNLRRIQYERLVEDFDTEVGALLDALGLPFEEQCRRFFESGMDTRTASYHQVTRPLYRSSVGRWRNYQGHIGPVLAMFPETRWDGEPETP